MSAAFEAWADEARARPVKDAAELMGARLKRVGSEWVGPCPACGGRRDKLSVHPGRNVWNCGHHGGAGGDAIALVQHVEGASFLRACEILTGRPAPDGRAETEAERAEWARRRAERERRAAEDTERRSRAEASYREAERRRAHRHWRSAGRIGGTIAEAYLGHRGLVAPAGARLRFAPRHDYYAPGLAPADRPRLIHTGPAMLAAITGPDGLFRGLHATWLDARLGGPDMPAEASGKAEIVDPETGEVLPAKKVRGSAGGHRIELVRVAEPAALYLGEGIETVLSVWMALAEARPELVAGAAFWAAISLGNLAGRAIGTVPHPTLRKPLDRHGRERGAVRAPSAVPDLAWRALVVPDGVARLTLLGDGDSEPFATGLALERAAARHARRSDGTAREVAIAMAPAGRDFNQVWRQAA